MHSGITSARGVLIAACIALGGLGAWLVSRHFQSPGADRPRYVLINETGQHDYDLAFRMSLRLAEKKSGIENALVLLASLPPSKTIEQTATELFGKLRIGERHNGRGILYLYSAQENLMKIEVSYALEGDIPDVYCRRVEEAAKTYMLSEIPQDFISELIITTNLRSTGGTVDDSGWAAPGWLNSRFLSGGGGALAHGYGKTLDDYETAIRSLPATELKDYTPAADARVSAERYLAALAAGIGDPRLPLLTEGSRLFRAVVPRNKNQEQRIAEFFRAAGPYRLLYAGDLALVVPGVDHSNLPFVLRRGTDRLWYVDEAKSWTYFHRFEDDVNFFVKYPDNPFFGALKALRLPHMEAAIYEQAATPPRPPYPFSLSAAIGRLEDRVRAGTARAPDYAALGDLYLFEANWISRAITSYEAASRLAPGEPSYRWRLVDLYLNDSRADKMLAQLKVLAESRPVDARTQAWYRYYRQQYDSTN